MKTIWLDRVKSNGFFYFLAKLLLLLIILFLLDLGIGSTLKHFYFKQKSELLLGPLMRLISAQADTADIWHFHGKSPLLPPCF